MPSPARHALEPQLARPGYASRRRERFQTRRTLFIRTRRVAVVRRVEKGFARVVARVVGKVVVRRERNRSRPGSRGDGRQASVRAPGRGDDSRRAAAARAFHETRDFAPGGVIVVRKRRRRLRARRVVARFFVAKPLRLGRGRRGRVRAPVSPPQLQRDPATGRARRERRAAPHVREVLGSKPGELAGEAVAPRVRRAARVSLFLRLAPRARVERVHAQSVQGDARRRRRARCDSRRPARDRTADLPAAGLPANASVGSRRAGSESRAVHAERGVARRYVHVGETPSAAGGYRGEPRDRGSIDGGRVSGSRREARLRVIPERVQSTGRVDRGRHFPMSVSANRDAPPVTNPRARARLERADGFERAPVSPQPRRRATRHRRGADRSGVRDERTSVSEKTVFRASRRAGACRLA